MTSQELKKLVDDFGTAALRAGQSNSGVSMNVCGNADWSRMKDLRETLHNKIDAVCKRAERGEEFDARRELE